MWELELLGLAETQTAFGTLEDGLDNPEAFLKGEGAQITGAAIRQNFLSGGRPSPWPDITAESRAQRKVNSTSGPLIDAGTLMAAASATSSGVDGSVFAVDGSTLTLGTDLVYAATQNWGREDANIPAREFEDLQPEDELRLATAFQDDYLHSLLAAMS